MAATPRAAIASINDFVVPDHVARSDGSPHEASAIGETFTGVEWRKRR